MQQSYPKEVPQYDVTQADLSLYYEQGEIGKQRRELGAQIKVAAQSGGTVEPGVFGVELVDVKRSVSARDYRAKLVEAIGEAAVRQFEGGKLKGANGQRIKLTIDPMA